jgi:hypothetical protein
MPLVSAGKLKMPIVDENVMPSCQGLFVNSFDLPLLNALYLSVCIALQRIFSHRCPFQIFLFQIMQF